MLMSRSTIASADNSDVLVRLQWLFFDPNHPNDTNFMIGLSQESFNDMSRNTRRAFIEALGEEFNFIIKTGLAHISLYTVFNGI
jgi:hypothetical protein